jgi:FKBP-type peptidyl-prolyl cis-trans isomerase 2
MRKNEPYGLGLDQPHAHKGGVGRRAAYNARQVSKMENGSIVHIDYDLYNADDDVLIETTREEVAKEADKFDENRTYTPLITVIGDGRLIAGFEAHLGEADAETDYEFDIAPEDAYGERDPNAVETMGQDVLARSVRDPDSLAIGGPVEINGKQGVLQMVRAGRARIDFNHPLAGRTLRYKYRIIKVVEDRAEKVTTLLETNTGRDGFEVSFDGDDLTITLPEFVAYDQNWSFTKFSLIRTLRDHVGVETIVFREVHEARQVGEEE